MISCFQSQIGHKNIGNIGDEIFKMVRWRVPWTMDVFAFVRVAEMSAAHKAFWLPLSQQSDTASDLGLIRLSTTERHGMWRNCWNLSVDDIQAVLIMQTHTYSNLTS